MAGEEESGAELSECSEQTKYSDPGEPTCKYCGGSVSRVVPGGTPYWHCEQHGRLQLSEVLDVQTGVIRG
jgi:hypothetical protein